MVAEEPDDAQSSTKATSQPEVSETVKPAPSGSRSGPPRAMSARRIVAGVVAAGVALGIGLFFFADRGPSGPVETVEAFFDAVVDKDVETALSYVDRTGSGVPYGEEAAFLHPDAIADGWELVKAERSAGADTWVRVMIGDGERTEQSRIRVVEDEDEWRLVDPLIPVTVAASPFNYAQVNDRVVVDDQLYASDLLNNHMAARQYQLFPGSTSFFGDLEGVDAEPEGPELLLSSREPDAEPLVAVPPELSFPDVVQQAAQDAMEELIDECVQSQRVRPVYCPFAADATLHDDEYRRVENLHDVEWTVAEYPTVRLADSGQEGSTVGLRFRIDDPGSIEFSAVGERQDDGETVDVVADCEVVVPPQYVAVTHDGDIDVYLPSDAEETIPHRGFDGICELDHVG